ncbi:MAG: sporulation peptidase YabG [Clostridia bacterium]|nr:sporulation peptidase YabG [Clostridia bacterium]
MSNYRIGDIVTRKSYGGDIAFKVVDVIDQGRSKPSYVLKGLIYRIMVDADDDDLVQQDSRSAYQSMYRFLSRAEKYAFASTRSRTRPVFGFPMLLKPRTRAGKILQLDGDGEFLEKCLYHYRKSNIAAFGRAAAENEQPHVIKELLQRYRPDIVVATGHDSIKKNADKNNLNSYKNSRYFIQSVMEARSYEPDPDKLCIFAGACQSFFEGIMSAGANFASSPGRILINALDPALVGEKVSLTDFRKVVTPQQAASVTISGREGIWGIDTKGRMRV